MGRKGEGRGANLVGRDRDWGHLKGRKGLIWWQ